MAKFNLNKGDRFNLSKNDGNDALVNVRIGLGWQTNENPGGPKFDLDVSAFMIGSNFKIPDDGFFVFYGANNKGKDGDGNLRPLSQDGALFGAVDEREGDEDENSEGDTEDMILNLSKVDPKVEQIIIVVTICKYPNDEDHDKRTLALNFGMVKNCYVRLLDERTGEEVLRYNLGKEASSNDAVEFCRLYRIGKEWEFEAMGRGSDGSLPGLMDLYA